MGVNENEQEEDNNDCNHRDRCILNLEAEAGLWRLKSNPCVFVFFFARTSAPRIFSCVISNQFFIVFLMEK